MTSPVCAFLTKRVIFKELTSKMFGFMVSAALILVQLPSSVHTWDSPLGPTPRFNFISLWLASSRKGFQSPPSDSEMPRGGEPLLYLSARGLHSW